MLNNSRVSRCFMLLLVLIFILISFIGCAESGNEEIKQESAVHTPAIDTSDTFYPEDFDFCLNFNTYGRNQIDTYKGTFTKDLVLDGTMTIDFEIPEDMKRDIFKLMIENEIMSLPDELKVEGMAVTPACDYKLTVTMDGKTKEIIWKEGFSPALTDKLPKENQKFLEIVKFISDYIYSTDEYKKMPKPNGGYD